MKIMIIATRPGSENSVSEWIKSEHEVVVCRSDEEAKRVLSSTSFDIVLSADAGPSASSNVVALPFTLGLTEQVEALEERLVNEAMAKTGHNQVKAAKLLKITRGALQYKLKKYAKLPLAA